MGSLFDTYDRLIAVGGQPGRRAWTSELRRAFEARTGAFAPEDAWFEARSRAFWDDVVTGGETTYALGGELSESDRAWLPAFACAHRGLFRVASDDHVLRIDDLLSGAAFVLHDVDDSLRPGFATVEALFDGRVVADPQTGRIAVLPGAFFHPAEATSAIDAVVGPLPKGPERTKSGARRRTFDVLDALLRMERTFRTLSRVKASYAYRPLHPPTAP